MAENNYSNFESSGFGEPSAKPAVQVNFKRILARAISLWYLIVLSVLLCLAGAYAYNRYAQRMYTVSASIIVREGTENAAAEFLYKSNPLVNPYRNFYNELYIMRSYPLLQGVVEQLNFQVAWYREGRVKTTEIYDSSFPFQVKLISSTGKPYGKNLGFAAQTDSTYSLEYLKDDGSVMRKQESIHFNDTISINGFTVVAFKRNMSESFRNKYFIVEFKDPFQVAQQYASRLKPTWAEQGSSVINLSLSGPLPEKEINFINKFIERYQQYDVDKKNLVASKSIEFLDKQLKTIGDSLQYFDNQIKSFKQSNASADFATASQQLLDRISAIETQVAQLTLYSNYFTYLEGYLKQSNNLDQVVPPTAVGISDEIITGLITKLMEVQFSMRMLGSQQTDQNPLVAQQQQRIIQLRGDILEGVKSIKATQKINREFLETQLKELGRELDKLPLSERTLIDIKRNYTIRENLYLFLMQKRAEAGISRASTTSDVVVVNPPIASAGFITPKPYQNYIMALLGGLLIPLLIFFLAELLNDKIQAKEDIEQLTTLPIIGAVGHNTNTESNLAVYERPRSALAESFRTLRSNLNYFTENRDKKIILITSSVSGEGKSFTTINLATTMAFSGKRVLIIGADMRKPRIYPNFNLNNDRGLSTYLSSMHSLDEVIQATQIDNLYLMSSGPVPPNPSELLLLPRVGAMFQTLLELYDYILLDTPPLGLVSDAFALMPFTHHTIFMIRQNYTPRYFLRDLQELVDKREIKHLSILFNDIKRTGPGYGYGYGYGFGEKRTAGNGYYED